MTAELPDCFEHVPGWLPAGEAAALLAALEAELPWQQTQMRIYGRDFATPRLTAWQGEASYAYSGARHEPAPWHPRVRELRDRLEVRAGAAFNSCLGNLYRDGRDSVSWHADNEPELGAEPVIASVSLGAARAFRIKPRHLADPRRWSIELAAGDLLIMRGRSQADYLHAVPKTARPVGPRLNLTFRFLG